MIDFYKAGNSMKNVRAIDDIPQVYADFLANRQYPKLESLNNWGKNRFFFSTYFYLIEDWHYTEQIVIKLNEDYFSLDTGHAPDFMDQARYLPWLLGELQA